MANFNLSGNVSDMSDWFMIKVKESMKSNLIDFISLRDKLSKPQLALFGRSLIILRYGIPQRNGSISLHSCSNNYEMDSSSIERDNITFSTFNEISYPSFFS